MQIDVLSRILRNPNTLEEIEKDFKSKQHVMEELVGTVVMARYGNFKTYVVESVDYTQTPWTKFQPHGSNEFMTYK